MQKKDYPKTIYIASHEIFWYSDKNEISYFLAFWRRC